MKKYLLCVLAMLLVLSLMGCGKAPADKTLGLSQWELNATAWSSSNGATVTLKATPIYHEKNQTASFIVRLEGEEIENVECQWEKDAYTAVTDLNAADGYCYYVVLRSADGEEAEIEVNTPNNVTNEDLINMEHALEAYCHMAVSSHVLNGDILTITGGTAQIQLPQITHDDKVASINKAELVLYHNDMEVDRVEYPLPEYTSEMEVNAVNFTIPALEDDDQLSVTMEVTLRDGQVLTAPGGTWFYTDGNLVLAIG